MKAFTRIRWQKTCIWERRFQNVTKGQNAHIFFWSVSIKFGCIISCGFRQVNIGEQLILHIRYFFLKLLFKRKEGFSLYLSSVFKFSASLCSFVTEVSQIAVSSFVDICLFLQWFQNICYARCSHFTILCCSSENIRVKGIRDLLVTRGDNTDEHKN